MSIAEIIQEANDKILSDIHTPNLYRRFEGADVGLDSVYGALYIENSTGDLIVPIGQNSSLRYYGGFEYVLDEHVMHIGQWVVYDGESDRVMSLKEYLEPLE
jgi:hypothetical protein